MSKHNLFFVCVLFLILLPATIFAEHPKMFFSASDIARLRAPSQTTHSAIWNNIKNDADSIVGKAIPSEPGNGDGGTGMDLISLAFAYVITGEQKYLDTARNHLVAIAGWTTWESSGIRDLPFHHMLLGYSLAYDWLYNDLDTYSRSTIQRALIQRAGESYEAASSSGWNWNSWWKKSFMQNHFSTNISALGVAALVLEGEDSQATIWLNYATNEIKKDSAFLKGINDGTWHESLYYQAYKLIMSLPFYYNLELLGKENDIIPDAYLNNYVYWRAYNYLPGTNRWVLNFADIYPQWAWNSYSSYAILRFVASQYNNGYAEWVAQQILSNRYRSRDLAPYDVFEYLFYDPNVTAISPSNLSLNRTFDDLGSVIWRTGWGSDDLVFGIKSGWYGGKYMGEKAAANAAPFNEAQARPHTGHDHPDANSFYFYKGGTVLAAEKAHYQQVRGSDYHNVIIVDGKERYKPIQTIFYNTNGKIENIYETEDFNFLTADATNLYRDNKDDWDGSPDISYLDECTRHVLFVKPNYVVMVDNLRSGTTHKYEWIIHFAEPGAVSINGDWVKGEAGDTGNNILGVNILAPTIFDYRIGNSTHPHPRDTETVPFVRISPISTVNNTRFINVLYPTTSQQWNNKPNMSLIGDTSQGAGVRVYLDGTHDHIFKYGTADEITIDEYRLKGKVASVLKDTSGTLKKIFIGNGSLLSDTNGNRVLIQSLNTNKTFEVIYSGTSLVLYGNNLQGLQIYAPGVSSSQVTVDGEKAIVSISGDYITIGDIIPPSLSNGSPSGTLSSETTSVTIGLTTNEPATCKYSRTQDVTYASMTNTFSATGGTSHSTPISGLSDGNSYSFYVRCQDASASGNANASDYIISFSVAMPAAVTDSLSPTIPGNLLASSISSSQINLTWTASTDNVGVTGYQIYRDGIQVDTSPTNSYSDTGLSPSTTYIYKVSAYDAAGNKSSQSSSASAATSETSAVTEGESGNLTLPMQMVSNVEASGGAYIQTTQIDSGTASYTFNIDESGSYKIIAMVYALDGSHDSFYVKIDNGEEFVWHLNPSQNPDEFNVWREDEVNNQGTGTPDNPQYDPYAVELNQGSHTITFRGREPNCRLDYFYFSKSLPTPTGLQMR